MIIRFVLVPAMLGIGGLLFAPDAAFAQKGGGGARVGGISAGRIGGSAGRVGGISAGRVGGISTARVGSTNIARTGNISHPGNMHHNGVYYHNGNYYHHGYNYGAFYPGFGLGIGLFSPFYGSSYIWNTGYSPRMAYYPTDGGQQLIPDQYAQDPPKNAQLMVLLSDPNAKVWFDGAPTVSTGTERLYYTPDLSPSANNSYRIRATWTANGKEVTQERVAPVAPGRGTVVDFTRPAAEGVAPPANK